MEKKKLIRELTSYNKGKALISKTSLRMWLGYGESKVADFVSGLPSLDGKYFVVDVADRIIERSIVKW